MEGSVTNSSGIKWTDDDLLQLGYSLRDAVILRGRRTKFKPKNCKVCKIEFYPRYKSQVYCSTECRDRRNQKPKEINRKCRQCNRVISDDKQSNIKYCSGACRTRACRARKKGRNVDM